MLLLVKELQYPRSVTLYVFSGFKGASLVPADGMVAVRYGWDNELLGAGELEAYNASDLLSQGFRRTNRRVAKD